MSGSGFGCGVVVDSHGQHAREAAGLVELEQRCGECGGERDDGGDEDAEEIALDADRADDVAGDRASMVKTASTEPKKAVRGTRMATTVTSSMTPMAMTTGQPPGSLSASGPAIPVNLGRNPVTVRKTATSFAAHRAAVSVVDWCVCMVWFASGG